MSDYPDNQETKGNVGAGGDNREEQGSNDVGGGMHQSNTNNALLFLQREIDSTRERQRQQQLLTAVMASQQQQSHPSFPSNAGGGHGMMMGVAQQGGGGNTSSFNNNNNHHMSNFSFSQQGGCNFPTQLQNSNFGIASASFNQNNGNQTAEELFRILNNRQSAPQIAQGVPSSVQFPSNANVVINANNNFPFNGTSSMASQLNQFDRIQQQQQQQSSNSPFSSLQLQMLSNQLGGSSGCNNPSDFQGGFNANAQSSSTMMMNTPFLNSQPSAATDLLRLYQLAAAGNNNQGMMMPNANAASVLDLHRQAASTSTGNPNDVNAQGMTSPTQLGAASASAAATKTSSKKKNRPLQSSSPSTSGFNDIAAAASPNSPSEQRDDPRWDLKFKALLKFRAEHGHCKVPARYKKDTKLGHWVMTQRHQYNNIKEGPGALSDERIKRLDEIGFIWSVRPDPVDQWKDRLEELKAYKIKHGDCMVPQRYHENVQLGTW
jgi:hypothetical protein